MSETSEVKYVTEGEREREKDKTVEVTGWAVGVHLQGSSSD